MQASSAAQSLASYVGLMFQILLSFTDNEYLMLKLHNNRELSESAGHTWQIAWSFSLVCKTWLNLSV